MDLLIRLKVLAFGLKLTTVADFAEREVEILTVEADPVALADHERGLIFHLYYNNSNRIYRIYCIMIGQHYPIDH